MIINRIYETQNLLSLWLVSFMVDLRTYQHRCIFSLYLIQSDFQQKSVIQHERCLIFSTNFIWNIPNSKKNWARCCQKCTSVFMKKKALFLSYLKGTWKFLDTFIFEKYSNVKFNGNLSCGSPVVPWRQEDMKKLTVSFRNFCEGT